MTLSLSPSEKVVVVDLGTTNFKVCRFDTQGQLEVSKVVPAPVERQDRVVVEIRPDEFRRCLASAVREVTGFDGSSESNVRAITFATQANSFALFDEQDEFLTPFILWSDLRARDVEFQFRSFSKTSEFRRTTGVASLDHLFLPAKLQWFRENSRDVWEQARRVSFISDYFTKWLTGVWRCEAATAALSGLVDIGKLDWWPAACDAAKVPVAWLPEIARSGTEIGLVQSKVANDLGLAQDCRLVMGCLDQHAGAIGAGNVLPGAVSETTGTVLATIRCAKEVDGAPVDSQVFRGPAFSDNLYYEMVFSEQSAGILERFRNEAAPDLSFSKLDCLAAESPKGSRGLQLHPEAYRRDTDHLFVGLQLHHSIGDKVRAILEGVADELAGQVRRLCGSRLPVVIHAAGGAAKSDLWLRIKSERLGIPVRAVECEEPTSLGSARLAIAALNASGGVKTT